MYYRRNNIKWPQSKTKSWHVWKWYNSPYKLAWNWRSIMDKGLERPIDKVRWHPPFEKRAIR